MTADQQRTVLTLLTVLTGVLFVALVLLLDLLRRARPGEWSGFLVVFGLWTLLAALGWLALLVWRASP